MRVLGFVGAGRGGVEIDVGGHNQRLALALLVAHAGQSVSMGAICDGLWPDEQPRTATATVHTTMSRLRRLLSPELQIVNVRGSYALSGDLSVIDVVQFEHEASAPVPSLARLTGAVSLWHGRAYEPFGEHPALRTAAARLNELRCSAVERLIDARLLNGADPGLIGDLDQLVAEHPQRERFRLQLMSALHLDGRDVEALRQATEFRNYLRDLAGVDSSPALKALEARILGVSVGHGRSRRTDGAASGTGWSAGRVTDESTSLIGRGGDLDAISQLVRTERVVTLVGTGGVGKTRLARRVAAVLAVEFAHGAVMVELGVVNESQSVVAAVANALDLQRRQHHTLEDTLAEVLRDREQLLVLDNCEHVVHAVRTLVERLLRSCPDLRVLTTSRELLAVHGETVFTVAPLDVPAAGAEIDVNTSSAVALFLDRARASRPAFLLDTTNAEAVGELCRRLDGLPLAIELAAVRLRSLGPEAILTRLDQRLTLLDAGAGSQRGRHQNLGALVEWSYQLLSPVEQTVFRQLSVFSGGFGLDAVEVICDQHQSANVLFGLVDKSIVQVIDFDEPRYRLLETLRQFGRSMFESVDPDGITAEELADRHLRYFLGLAERAGEHLTGSAEAQWATAIDHDFDNIRAAFNWAVARSDSDAALRLVAALREYAFRRIRYELSAWAETASSMSTAAAHPCLPIVRGVVAYGHFVRGDLEVGLAVAHDALDAAQGSNDPSSGLLERALANIYFYLGRTDDAVHWMDEMVRAARVTQSPARLAHALYMRSVAETCLGRPDRGAELGMEAVETATAAGSPTAVAQASYAVGLALEATDVDAAHERLEYASRTAAGVGNRWIEAFARTEVLWLQASRGDPVNALRGFADVIDTWFRGGDWANLWLSLRHVFGVFHQLDDLTTAAVLHGALTAAGAAYALPFQPIDAARLEAITVDVRARLGPSTFSTEVRRGAAMTDTDIVGFILERISTQAERMTADAVDQ